MQAVILAGGEGTRLRPLTSRVAKPVVTLVDRPFIAYMLEWLRRHGVDEVILCCGFGAEGVRAVLGDGSRTACACATSRSPSRSGTAGPLQLAADLLERALPRLQRRHPHRHRPAAPSSRRTSAPARSATLALVAVEDPSAYGLVRDRARRRRPRVPREAAEAGRSRRRAGSAPAPTCSSARCSTLIEPGRAVSIEREVWPALVGHGLYAPSRRAATGWTSAPRRATCRAASTSSPAPSTSTATARTTRRRSAPAARSRRTRGSASWSMLGERRAGRRSGASIERSVVLAGAHIGDGAVLRDSIVAERAKIGAYAELEEDVVVGEDAEIAAHSRIAAGTRVAAGRAPVSALDRASIDALDSGRMLANILGMAEQMGDALWRVESAAIEPIDTPGGLVVAGMGGSAIGGAARPRRARRPGLAADPLRARLRPAAVDDARHHRAVRQLLGQHRGDARLLRVGGRARRAADRRDDRRARWPSRRAPSRCR